MTDFLLDQPRHPEQLQTAAEIPRQVADFVEGIEHPESLAAADWLPSSFDDRQLAELENAPNMLRPGTHLNPELTKITGHSAEAVPQSITFGLDRSRGFDAGQSAHGVFFGDIGLTLSDRDEAAVVPVAVKSFRSNPGKAVHEYGQLMSLRDKGFDVFLPVAIHVDSDCAYLLTHYEGDLATFDNENWRYHKSPESERALIEDRLVGAANALAELHTEARTFHGDFKKRNIVRTVEGATRLIDFEKATLYPDENIWLDHFKDKAVADIMELYKSLEEGKGLFHKQSVAQRNALFRDLFVDHYVKATVNYGQQLSEESRQELHDAVTRVQDSIFFKVYEDWDKRKFPPSRRDPEALDVGKLVLGATA